MDAKPKGAYQVAGEVLKTATIYAGWTTREAPDHIAGVSGSALASARRGNESVTFETWRQIELGLKLPIGFFGYVIRNQKDKIAKLPEVPGGSKLGLTADLKRFTIDALQDLDQPPRNRRATDLQKEA